MNNPHIKLMYKYLKLSSNDLINKLSLLSHIYFNLLFSYRQYEFNDLIILYLMLSIFLFFCTIFRNLIQSFLSIRSSKIV